MSLASRRKPRSSGCVVIKHWLMMAAPSFAAELTGSLFLGLHSALWLKLKEQSYSVNGRIYSISVFSRWAKDSVKQRNCTPHVWILFVHAWFYTLFVKEMKVNREPPFIQETLSKQTVHLCPLKQHKNCTKPNRVNWSSDVSLYFLDLTWHFQTHSFEFLLCNYSSIQIVRHVSGCTVLLFYVQ